MVRLQRLAPVLLAAAATAAVAGPRSAQCLSPDGLDGPCCTQTVAALPSFPAITLPGKAICWDACAVASQPCAQVALDAPIAVNCAEYTADLSVFDCSGQPLLSSALHLDYTRTWEEVTPTGLQYQVWRFVVKADAAAASTGPPTCPIPSCLGTWPTAFYYGYVDYARECSSGAWEASLVLFHGCDAFQHDQAISDKPGTYHPTTSYALVAPSTTANPFVPAVSPAFGGAVFMEAIRKAADPASLGCWFEEPLTQGDVAPVGAACACPFSFFPPQVTARHMEGVGACGSDFRSLDVFPNFPWLEVMTTSIGAWTTTASYPGPEVVWVDEGVFLHDDACDPPGTNAYAEIRYGASTQGGFQAFSAGVVFDRMTDMVDNWTWQLGTPLPFPFVGSVKPTDRLIYLNVF